MRLLRWCGLFLAGLGIGAAQGVQPSAAGDVTAEINAALTGSWAGVLEYRDYQSDGRVKLPTWLVVAREGRGLRFHYIYDDGPTKTVEDSELVTIDATKATYAVLPGTGKAAEVEAIAGLDAMKNGRGTLLLAGPGTENGHAVDLRTTLRIGRNILEILRESRLPGEDYKFRDAYTLTRSGPPGTASKR